MFDCADGPDHRRGDETPSDSAEGSAMGEVAAGLIWKLHQTDPYAGFPYLDYPLYTQGGQEDPTLLQLVTRLRPRLLIEVGSWKGDTAIRLASLLKQEGAD